MAGVTIQLVSGRRHLAFGLMAAGLAPFAAGALLAHNRAGRMATGWLRCPVRALTGVPCPSCGSSRAFIGLAARDSSWRGYNGVAVCYAALVTLLGLSLNILPGDARRKAVDRLDRVAADMRRRPALAIGIVTLVALPAWAAAWRTELLQRAQLRKSPSN